MYMRQTDPVAPRPAFALLSSLTAMERSLARRLFFSVWTVYSLFWTPFLVREHFPALALVERGSFNVERYAGWCEDIFPGPKGGAYINNNPGASLTAAIPLAIVKPILGWLDRNGNPPGPQWRFPDTMFESAAREGRGLSMLLATFITVAGVNAAVTAFSIAFAGVRLLQFGVPAHWAAGVCLLYAFGTPVFFRTGYLNHNLLVGDAGFVALLLLWHPNGRPITSKQAMFAGLLCGYAILCDFTGLVVTAAVSGYLLWRVWEQSRAGAPRIAIVFAAAVVPGVLGLLLYQLNAFGNPLLPPQHYMAPTAPTAQGYRGFDWPSPALAWANFFHPEFGLFAYCPLLAMGLAAPFVRNITHRIPKPEMMAMLAYFVTFVIFCAANQYSWLQWATGFRYLVPIVPMLFLLAMQTLQALPACLRWTLAAASLIESGASALTRHHHVGTAFLDAFQNPLRIHWIERMVSMGVMPEWSGWGNLFAGGIIVLLVSVWLPFLRRGSGTDSTSSSVLMKL